MKNEKNIDKIYAYKHDGSFHRLWTQVELLKETKDYYIFANKKGSFVNEKGDYFWKTKEDAIIYFSKNHWFNIIVMYKKGRVVYYCNLATPPILEQQSLKYIDYELDVKYFSNTRDAVVLDENEYNYYKDKYGYPKWLMEKIEDEKNLLLSWMENEVGPFAEAFREEWNIF